MEDTLYGRLMAARDLVADPTRWWDGRSIYQMRQTGQRCAGQAIMVVGGSSTNGILDLARAFAAALPERYHQRDGEGELLVWPTIQGANDLGGHEVVMAAFERAIIYHAESSDVARVM